MARTKEQPGTGTATRILDVAERLAQQCGFNGFSYADVSAELNVTTASLHYHFRGKAELGEALIVRYQARFGEALAAIDDAIEGAPAKLEAYARIYSDVLRAHRMCLCGMLAAEYQTLPGSMQTAVVGFFDQNETWLERVIGEGQAAGTLRAAGDPRELARLVVSTLEGAMLLSRPYGEVGRFEALAGDLVASLVGR